MRTRKTERTAQYSAVDSAGKVYQVVEYTDFLNVRTSVSTHDEWEPGLKMLKLADGRHLNPTDQDDVFEILGTATKVRLKK